MNERLALRAAYRRGDLDKHAYARAMAEQHAALTEYVTLLGGSAVDAIEISERGIWMRSRLAPVWVACDPADRGNPPIVSVNFGSYEQDEFAAWRSLLPGGARIADVGANIGWYAAHAAAMDARASVVAFEPVPASFESLSRTVDRNELSNVVIENVAVSDHTDGIVLVVDPTIAGAASAYPTIALDHAVEIRVPSVTLDGYAADRGLHFDAIKLDVEGGELAVLHGAEHVLGTDRPLVLCEMLRRHARAFGYHPNDILRFMDGLGYRCFSLSGRDLRPFDTMTEETVETNFFFLHGEAHAAQVAAAQA